MRSPSAQRSSNPVSVTAAPTYRAFHTPAISSGRSSGPSTWIVATGLPGYVVRLMRCSRGHETGRCGSARPRSSISRSEPESSRMVMDSPATPPSVLPRSGGTCQEPKRSGAIW